MLVRRWPPSLAASIAAVALVGCGGDDPPARTLTVTNATTTDPTTAPPAPTPADDTARFLDAMTDLAALGPAIGAAGTAADAERWDAAIAATRRWEAQADALGDQAPAFADTALRERLAAAAIAHAESARALRAYAEEMARPEAERDAATLRRLEAAVTATGRAQGEANQALVDIAQRRAGE